MQLHYLETHLVDHCDLGCKGCGHFSSLSEKRYADFDVFKRDFIRLGELFDNISTIRLMGGEPLLRPDVQKFLRFSRDIFPDADVCLVTNGIRLCGQPEGFWAECARSRIIVQVTRYPIKLDMERIRKKGERFGVRIDIGEPITEFFSFINVRGDSVPATAFRNCRSAFRCPFLRDGRISPCALPQVIHIFNNYFGKKIPVSNSDYMNIHDDIDGADVLKFLSSPIPMCRWCLHHWPIYEWGISEKKIDEWGDTNPGLAKRLFGVPRKMYYNYPASLKERIEHEARKFVPDDVRVFIRRLCSSFLGD